MIIRYDVVLIGGGIAGLMAAHKLCDLGMRVALIERQSTLASGPSTRNEGWLHRGTYHAASIKSRGNAVQVARRCIYGHEQLRRFCPEAVEDGDRRPLVMIRDAGMVDEVISRWSEAEVQCRPITREAAQTLAPDADFQRASAIFEANDVSLNTRLVYRKLFALAGKSGCDFYIGNQIDRIDGQVATVTGADGDKLRLEARKFVYSAGTGTKSLFERFHAIDLPIRFWKSHLVITKRLAPVGVFFVDAHEAAMMHHGAVSIVGLNEDALLSAEPSYDVIAERAANVRRAIARIFPSWDDAAAIEVACTKVDLVADPSGARSLNIAVVEPKDGHICVLPGKMTEAPYLTDVLVSYLHQRLEGPPISLRPCDNFGTNQAIMGAA